MKRLLAIAISLCALVACDQKEDPAPAQPASAAKPAPAPVDRRDQYALARDIVAALTVDAEADPDALPKVIKAWQGRRFRWELAFIPALCTQPDRCVVAPFDHKRFERPIGQGWLPRLELDKKTFAALRERCKSYQQCIIEVEARIEKLRLSAELPTQLTLNEVQIERAREAQPTESWIVSRAPKKPTKAARRLDGAPMKTARR
jgi:hypothetical protein